MAVEIIEGTVQGATVRQSNAKVSIYESVVFTRDDGSERRLDKVAVAPAVAALLQPGAQGRFYAYSAIDHNGLVAARTRDGRSAYAIPSGNEKIMMIAAIVGIAWSAIRLGTGGFPLLAIVLAIGGSVGWFLYRRTRIDTRARYDADSGYA
ncbi:MAG TPA: hypothetical protein VGD21_05905 [Lysobacter sp.]